MTNTTDQVIDRDTVEAVIRDTAFRYSIELTAFDRSQLADAVCDYIESSPRYRVGEA